MYKPRIATDAWKTMQHNRDTTTGTPVLYAPQPHLAANMQQHAADICILSDASAVRMALSRWDPATMPVMDLRPLQSYLEGPRLSRAAYVPSHDIASHCFWLPDKDHPFAVVMPAHGDLPVQECASLPAFLESRQWTSVAFYVRDSQVLWNVAQELGLVDPPGIPQHVLLQRFMFRPCPLLLEEVSRIEACLLADAQAAAAVVSACACASQHQVQEQVLAPSLQQQQQQQQQQQGVEERSIQQQQQPPEGAQQGQQHQTAATTSPRFRCLEPGCGAGRNVIWLAARHTHSSSSSSSSSSSTSGDAQVSQAASHQHMQAAPSWSVLGIDNWYASLVRTQDLCQASNISPQTASFWYATISPDTGLLEALPTPNASSKHGDKQLTHIQLSGDMQLGDGCWHLVLCVRFLERAFLPHIRALLAPGGFLLYCTFLDMDGTRKFGRPKGNNHLLQRHELASLFGDAQGFDILRDDIALCRDGRELSMFVARKRPAQTTASGGN